MRISSSARHGARAASTDGTWRRPEVGDLTRRQGAEDGAPEQPLGIAELAEAVAELLAQPSIGVELSHRAMACGDGSP